MNYKDLRTCSHTEDSTLNTPIILRSILIHSCIRDCIRCTAAKNEHALRLICKYALQKQHNQWQEKIVFLCFPFFRFSRKKKSISCLCREKSLSTQNVNNFRLLIIYILYVYFFNISVFTVSTKKSVRFNELKRFVLELVSAKYWLKALDALLCHPYPEFGDIRLWKHCFASCIPLCVCICVATMLIYRRRHCRQSTTPFWIRGGETSNTTQYPYSIYLYYGWLYNKDMYISGSKTHNTQCIQNNVLFWNKHTYITYRIRTRRQ